MKAHWRHLACSDQHPEAFVCEQHRRTCRPVWVRACHRSNELDQMPLLELSPEQVQQRRPQQVQPRRPRWRQRLRAWWQRRRGSVQASSQNTH